MDWTLVFVADMVAGLGAREKKRLRKDMVAVLVLGLGVVDWEKE